MLARGHGFGSDEGRIALGRFIVEGRDGDGAVVFCVVTPIARTMAATTVCDDIVLPAGSDTVEISAPDARSNPVRCEALPPGTRVRARLRAAERGLLH